MKKIIKKFCKLIGKIILFFDRILITPIMKLVIKIGDFVKGGGNKIEKFITSKSVLLIISLLIAFLAFYKLDRDSSILLNSYAERLNSQPVTSIYNEEAYVVEGLPKTADVVMIGNKSNIFLAKQYPTTGITVDLRDLSVGTHKVELKYSQAFSFVDYTIDPSYVTVVIYDKISATREVDYEVLHREALDSKLDITDVTLSKTEVTIKGNEKSITSVGYVKALIDLNDLVNPKSGDATIKNCRLVAYDDNGEVVDVEILPSTVEAQVTLSSSSKSVPIKVIPNNKLALGYAIDSLSLSSNSIEIYGNEENLSKIDYVPVYIDVNGLNENKTFNVNIDKPAGVRDMNLKTITVKLTVTKESQTEVSGITVNVINLASGLDVKASSEEYNAIDIIVKGSEKAISALDKSKIVATIDLAKYTSPGEYDVDVTVTGDDVKLSYEPKITKVRVIIRKK